MCVWRGIQEINPGLPSMEKFYIWGEQISDCVTVRHVSTAMLVARLHVSF